jgi:hypothetical protein
MEARQSQSDAIKPGADDNGGGGGGGERSRWAVKRAALASRFPPRRQCASTSLYAKAAAHAIAVHMPHALRHAVLRRGSPAARWAVTPTRRRRCTSYVHIIYIYIYIVHTPWQPAGPSVPPSPSPTAAASRYPFTDAASVCGYRTHTHLLRIPPPVYGYSIRIPYTDTAASVYGYRTHTYLVLIPTPVYGYRIHTHERCRRRYPPSSTGGCLRIAAGDSLNPRPKSPERRLRQWGWESAISGRFPEKS